MEKIAEGNLREYKVWDRTTRWFHWINVLSVLGLIAVGTFILYNKALGISTEGKIILKTLHVLIGYVFVINLLWRIIWGFIAKNRYARIRAIVPGGRGYMKALSEYTIGFIKADAPGWLGHNPLGRLMVTALLLLLLVMGGTGLILAGTDIYYPPFGNQMKTWIAADQTKLDLIVPYGKENIDEARNKEMKDFRKPIVETHERLYFYLIALIIIHIAAAVITDIRERNYIISAMFNGRKVFGKKPLDADEQK